jgi:hypothetical protein
LRGALFLPPSGYLVNSPASGYLLRFVARAR